jgi:hypothetical protein
MIRLNYHAPERIISTAVLRDFWKQPQIRRAVGAALTVTCFIAAVWTVENVRLHLAHQRLLELRARYTIVAKRRHDVEALVAQVKSLELLRTEVIAARRSGADKVAEVVAIGNRLPPSVYLEGIRPVRNAWVLTGHASSIDDLGEAVHALANVGGGTPRLLDLHEETVRNVTRVRYSINIDRASQP